MNKIIFLEDSHFEAIIFDHPKRLEVHDKRPENCKEEFQILGIHFRNGQYFSFG